MYSCIELIKEILLTEMKERRVSLTQLISENKERLFFFPVLGDSVTFDSEIGFYRIDWNPSSSMHSFRIEVSLETLKNIEKAEKNIDTAISLLESPITKDSFEQVCNCLSLPLEFSYITFLPKIDDNYREKLYKKLDSIFDPPVVKKISHIENTCIEEIYRDIGGILEKNDDYKPEKYYLAWECAKHRVVPKELEKYVKHIIKSNK